MSKRPRPPFAYEHKAEPVASTPEFRRRLLASGGATVLLLGASLVLGMAGYHWIVGIPRWVDCFHSAAMIMGGMGPVDPAPTTDAGKLFAGAYALYSGVMLLASVGLLLAPALHRLLHRLHVETDE